MKLQVFTTGHVGLGGAGRKVRSRPDWKKAHRHLAIDEVYGHPGWTNPTLGVAARFLRWRGNIDLGMFAVIFAPNGGAHGYPALDHSQDPIRPKTLGNVLSHIRQRSRPDASLRRRTVRDFEHLRQRIKSKRDHKIVAARVAWRKKGEQERQRRK